MPIEAAATVTAKIEEIPGAKGTILVLGLTVGPTGDMVEVTVMLVETRPVFFRVNSKASVIPVEETILVGLADKLNSSRSGFGEKLVSVTPTQALKDTRV